MKPRTGKSSDDAQQMFAVALKHHEQRQMKEAVESYKKAILLKPDLVEAIASLGNALTEMGRLDEAVASYEQALAIRPDFAEIFVVLGNARKAQEKFDDAQTCYQKAIALKPLLAEAHNNLGTILNQKSDFGAAVASYKRAIEIKPDYAVAYNNLGTAFKMLRDFDSALASYKKAIALHPNYASAYNNMGGLFFDQGKTAEADLHYKRALELNPQFAEGYIGLGDLYKSQGKIDDAIGCYERSIEIKPDLAEAHNNLGNAIKLRGDLDGAVRCYERAIALKPGYAAGVFNLGSTLAEQNRPEDAKPLLYRCLELDPQDNFGARLLLAKLGALDIPKKASDAHMQNLYAGRAGFWDHGVKSGSLYRGHELVVNAFARLSDKKDLDILDAGCGTGLVGTLIRARAKSLDGIDLSPAMLEKAREKGVYDRLYPGDLVDFMEKSPHSYDVITCAATLIHFGDLQPVFAAIALALRADGLFIATLFPNDDQDGVSVAPFGLAQGGCYAHGSGYLNKLAVANGLAIEALDTEIHEYSKGSPTLALVMALRKKSGF